MPTADFTVMEAKESLSITELALMIADAYKSWTLEGLAEFGGVITRDKLIDSRDNWKACLVHLQNALAAAEYVPFSQCVHWLEPELL